MSEIATSRRKMLQGVAAAGVAVPVLAACGSSGADSSPTAQNTPNDDVSATPDGSSPASSGDAIKTADIPVGGGKIYADEKIVVTQPVAGEFKAFTAVCTHRGCIVSSVKDKQIDCACHGSRYSITDGSVEGGPAPRPLAEKKVAVSGATLTVS